MELLPNLHWIEGRASNVYLWSDEDGLILVDSGMPGDAKKILHYVGQLGHQPADIKAILVTHADIDHVGAVAAIQKESQAPVLTGRETAGWLLKGKSPPHLPRLAQFFSNLLFGFKPLTAEIITILDETGPLPDILDGWQMIATPGHTNDHHSFYLQRAGILFAGDALNTRGGTLNLTPDRITFDGLAARHSAQRLVRLNPAVIACGHGRPLHEHSAEDLFQLFRQLEVDTN